jgi:hypothetical protein
LPLKVLAKKDFKENINAAIYFTDKKKLTKRGELILCEHVDQKPLYLMQVGMASRARKYIFQKDHQKKYPHVGPFGEVIKRNTDFNLPLLGQLDKRGITILSNDLYHAPIFYQESNDFLCNLFFPQHSTQPTEILI